MKKKITFWMKPFQCLITSKYVRDNRGDARGSYNRCGNIEKPIEVREFGHYSGVSTFCTIDKPLWNFDQHCLDRNRKVL